MNAPQSQCPLQQNKDFNPYAIVGLEPGRGVAMPPPTEQGFQPDIAHPAEPQGCRNAPSNRTRISTKH